MSIHDFHSKLMSGKEEGTLIEGLRRLRGICRPALSEAEPGWAYWTDGEGESGAAAPGWTNWETEALPQV
ncbi:MAG: hypothetical protein ACLGI9_11890 [Thermoanaerobaculia bacterium]